MSDYMKVYAWNATKLSISDKIAITFADNWTVRQKIYWFTKPSQYDDRIDVSYDIDICPRKIVIA